MLKPRISKVVFSAGVAPSESEYYDEINQYSKKFYWIFLLFLARTMIPLANGVQISFYSILTDINGTCYIEDLGENNWTYDEIVDISCTSKTQKCEYLGYNYTLFKNLTFKEALVLKKKLPLPKIKKCFRKRILLSTACEDFHASLHVFCKSKNLSKRLIFLRCTSLAFGGFFFGILGDLYGRRKISLYSVSLWCISSLILAVVHKLTVIQIFYFVANFCYMGTDILSYINLLEICHKKVRFFCVLTFYGYTIGFVVCTHFSHRLHYGWEYMQWVTFCFTLLAVFTCWYMPESPRWLINKMKYSSALEVMKEITGEVPDEILFEGDSESSVSLEVFLNMIRYLRKRKLKVTAILCLVRISISFIFETAVWKFVSLKPLVTRLTVIEGATEVLSLPYALILYAGFGKKYGLFWTFTSLNMLSLISLIIRETFAAQRRIRIIIIMNAVTALRFHETYMPDLYSAFLRATSFGLCGLFSNLTRAGAIYFIDWKIVGDVPIYILYISFSLSGILILKLPDSTHADLPYLKLYKV